MSETQRCSQRIFSTRRDDVRGHSCQFKATGQYKGKWYCKRHHPDPVKARLAAQDAKWKAEWKARREADERQATIQSARDAIVQAAWEWVTRSSRVETCRASLDNLVSDWPHMRPLIDQLDAAVAEWERLENGHEKTAAAELGEVAAQAEERTEGQKG